MEEDIRSTFPPSISTDQILFSKISAYFRMQRILTQRKRSIFKDFNYCLKIVLENNTQPIQFLYRIGFIALSNEIVAIQKKKLATLFQYSKQGLVNSILRHNWVRLKPDSSDLPFDFKSVPNWKTWRIFKLQKNDSISLLLLDQPNLWVRDVKSLIEIGSNTSSLMVLMCQCETFAG